jgi:hypothetical protein
MNDDRRALRIQVLIGLMCLALVGYLILLSRTGVLLIRSGEPAAIGLGAAIFILPVIGAWAMFATLRDGLNHQRLARQIRDAGMELDVSGLRRMPSGRIARDAADGLFEDVKADLDAHPDDWRRWYRVARAYDYAGDRRRARETMRKAADMEKAARGT